jgi:Fe-S cluster biogenesis protein NfuA
MTEEIKIMATPSPDGSSCTLAVDRPVYAGGSFYFPNPEKAKGSPLVEKIFEIDGIISVLVAENNVTVKKWGEEPWPFVAKKIANLIREQIRSGTPGISEELKKNLPPESVIAAKVQTVLDVQVNPSVASHGGFIELVDVKGNTVFLRMSGGCQGCGMASYTLKQGVEHLIRDQIPEVGEILDTTDHASGRNPYYQAH